MRSEPKIAASRLNWRRAGAFAICLCAAAGFAQETVRSASLPDAPSSVAPAGHFDKYVAPDQVAPRLSVTDKIVLGVRDAFSPASTSVWVLVAGYEQGFSLSPNWPRNGGGFARRLAAAAARDSSIGIFADSVFAPIFREDPRYYRLGPAKNVVYRVLYAVSRPIVTRTDGGHSAPNFALLTGTVFGSMLTDAYYPTVNQGVESTVKTFGGSMASSAIGFEVAEFANDILAFLHLQRRQ